MVSQPLVLARFVHTFPKTVTNLNRNGDQRFFEKMKCNEEEIDLFCFLEYYRLNLVFFYFYKVINFRQKKQFVFAIKTLLTSLPRSPHSLLPSLLAKVNPDRNIFPSLSSGAKTHAHVVPCAVESVSILHGGVLAKKYASSFDQNRSVAQFPSWVQTVRSWKIQKRSRHARTSVFPDFPPPTKWIHIQVHICQARSLLVSSGWFF